MIGLKKRRLGDTVLEPQLYNAWASYCNIDRSSFNATRTGPVPPLRAGTQTSDIYHSAVRHLNSRPSARSAGPSWR
jgi:hypothetical protein